ncbi:MAG: IS1249 family transposase [Firmicutes bacterium]|nr:IS1249 family transposase [Bacillota bacterium]MBR0442241.1 IS1249 family transposase [Bacillota bacterium]
MKHVICPVCGSICVKNGKSRSGSQRWLCRCCKVTFTPKIDNSTKQLQSFLKWLFSRQTQKEMPGEGRSFRRKTSQFWDIWPMPPKVEEARDVLYVDGIYLGRKACILICCDKDHVLGWYLCRYEHSGAWMALMARIAEPAVVVSDGGTGFVKALKKVWPHARHQRCVFHAFCQVKRYVTSKPKTAAGIELYMLSKELMHLEDKQAAEEWTQRFVQWLVRYNAFLSQMTRDENGELRPTHERLLKAEHSLVKLLKEGTLFTYMDESLKAMIEEIPSTNNRIEGGTNAQLRAMLRDHRGMSVERRIKAVFWWCYMHSPEPLSGSEILKVMPTDKSIADIYKRLSSKGKLEKSIPGWGDAVAWNEFHRSSEYPSKWD